MTKQLTVDSREAPLAPPIDSASLWAEVRRKANLYLFLVPTFVFLLAFMYYPAFTAIRLSFFSWDGFNDPTLDRAG